jgi:hypothetical protein
VKEPGRRSVGQGRRAVLWGVFSALVWGFQGRTDPIWSRKQSGTGGTTMDIATLRTFFGWCTVINVGMMILSFALLIPLSDFVYRVHSRLFPMSREAFNIIIYSYLGIYKILVIVFCLVPYVALSIMAG